MFLKIRTLLSLSLFLHSLFTLQIHSEYLTSILIILLKLCLLRSMTSYPNYQSQDTLNQLLFSRSLWLIWLREISLLIQTLSSPGSYVPLSARFSSFFPDFSLSMVVSLHHLNVGISASLVFSSHSTYLNDFFHSHRTNNHKSTMLLTFTTPDFKKPQYYTSANPTGLPDILKEPHSVSLNRN